MSAAEPADNIYNHLKILLTFAYSNVSADLVDFLQYPFLILVMVHAFLLRFLSPDFAPCVIAYSMSGTTEQMSGALLYRLRSIVYVLRSPFSSRAFHLRSSLRYVKDGSCFNKVSLLKIFLNLYFLSGFSPLVGVQSCQRKI